MSITNFFVGRKKEINQFLSWLNDLQAPSLLYFYETAQEEEKKGGVGKTQLLKRCAGLAAQSSSKIHAVEIDFFDIANRDGFSIAVHILSRLKSYFPAWDNTLIENAQETYQTETKHEMVIDAREKILDAVKNCITSLNQIMKYSNEGLVVFMDTFEMIEENPSLAVLQPYQLFPDTLGLEFVKFVIAGRNAIDWSHPNWIDRQNEVVCIQLDPFDRKDAIEYLDQAIYVYSIKQQAEEIINKLYKYTAGRPILLGLISDILNKRVISLEQLVQIREKDFAESLVYQINNFHSPLAWAVLFMAHIYHEFSQDLLVMLMKHSDFQELSKDVDFGKLVEEIVSLTFVRSTTTSGTFVLHEEMRRLVNIYCWNVNDPDNTVRRDLSNIAVKYYTKMIMVEDNQQRKQSLITIQLYHQLYYDLNIGFESFRSFFQSASQLLQVPFARALLHEVGKFSSDFTPAQKHFYFLAQVRLLRQEENPVAALKIVTEYEQQADLQEVERAEILFERAGIHQAVNQFDQSAKDYLAYLEIPTIKANPAFTARALTFLGFTYRQQGSWDASIKCYEQSLETARQLEEKALYADILNNIGNVYRLKGDIEDAILACQSSLRIRRDLFVEGKSSERGVALTINTLGMIYRDNNELLEAKKYFEEALLIFEGIGYNFGISNACTNIGFVHLLLDELDIANSYLQRAYQVATHRNLRSEQANSANKLGLLYLNQKLYDTAFTHFQTALEISQRISDNYQLAENYLGLAMCCNFQGLPASEFLKKSESIARKHSYYYLLGQAEVIQGDESFKKELYNQAFTHYGHACRFMTKYNSIKYNNTLRYIQEKFQQTPRERLVGVTDLVLNLWYEFGLDTDYPELLKLCANTVNYLG